MADGSQDANTNDDIYEEGILVVSPVVLCLIGIKQSIAAGDGDALTSWMDSLEEELRIAIHVEIVRAAWTN